MSESRRSRARTIAYWALTLIVSWEMVAGSIWDLLQIEYGRAVSDHLGYPHYLGFILGAWKLPCALTLLVPRFERLKEWAYAGAFFNYSGAAASHVLVGDGVSKWIVPIIFAAITLGSWAIRPADRRLAPHAERTALAARAWIGPVVIVVALLAISLATVPR